MAEPFDQLLLKMGIDLAPAKAGISELKTLLLSVNEVLGQLKAQTQSAVEVQAKAIDQVKSMAEASTVAAKGAIAGEQQKAGVLARETEEIRKQSFARAEADAKVKQAIDAENLKRAAIEASNAALANQKLREEVITAELQKQTAEFRKQRLEEAGGHGVGGERGLGNLGGKVAGAVLGRGLAGSIATGVLAGQGIGYLIEQSVEGVARFIEKLKEMQDQASQMTLIQNQFEGLAKAAGIDAAGAIAKMRYETEGLVSKMDLMKTANQALKSPFGLSLDQVSRLEGAVVKLAEANGRTAKEAIEGLGQAMASGRSQQLMFVTGLSRIAAQLENVSASAGRVTRGSLQMNQMFKLLTSQAEAMGEAPQTLQQMITRLSVSWHDLLLEFGRGFNLSAGLQASISMMRELTDSIAGNKSKAEGLGKTLGNVFLVVTEAVKTVIPVVEQLFSLLAKLGTAFSPLVWFVKADDNVKKLGADASDSAKKFEEMNPVLSKILWGVTLINAVLEKMLENANRLVSPFEKIADKYGKFQDYLNVRTYDEFKDLYTKGARPRTGSPPNVLNPVGQLFSENDTELIKPKPGERGGPLPFRNRLFPANPLNPPVGPNLPESSTKENAERRRSQTAFQNAQEDYGKAMELGGKAQEALNKARPGITPPQVSDVERQSQINKQIELDKKLEESRTKLQVDAAKNRLSEHLLDIQIQKEQDTAAYQDGEELLKKHLDKQEALERESFTVRQAYALDQLKGRNDKIREQIESTTKMYKGYTDEAGVKHGGLLQQQGADKVALQKQLDTILETLRNEELSNIKAYTDEVYTLTKTTDAAVANLKRQGARADFEARKKEIADQLALETTAINKRLALQEEQSRQAQGVTERALTRGEVSPEQYYQDRIAQIQELANVQKQAAADQEIAQQKAAVALFQNANKSPEAARAFIDSIHKASETYVQTVTKDTQTAIGVLQTLADKEIQIRQQDILHQYQPQVGALQGQITGLRNQPGTQAQVADLTAALANKLEEQKNQLLALLDITKPYSDDWYRIYDNVVKVNDEWVRSIEQLNQMRDLMQPIAAGFQAIGQGIQSNFHSRFAQNLAESVMAGARSIQESTVLGQRIRGKSAVPIDPRMQELQDRASGLFTAISASSQKVTSPLSELAMVTQMVIDKFRQFLGIDIAQEKLNNAVAELPIGNADAVTRQIAESMRIPGVGTGAATGGSKLEKNVTSLVDKFGAAVTAVTNFTGAILQAHSAIGGAAGGATAGLGLGKTISGALGIAGPWGAVGGAVIGGVVGAFTGAKNAAVTNNINKVQQQYKEIMQQFALNTNNLQQTIQQVAGLIAELQAMQASSKKGGDQYAQAIQGYIDQMNQLLAQQHQIIINMNEALAIANAPLAAQSFLGDLQDIFKTFQQNAGAASTVEDLANAYALLNAQLETYTQNQQQQLLQNNQQAIQDALQLNDLLFQQWQEQLQFNQQVQSILSQGVLVRTPTRAMTAGSEIYNLQVTYQRQQQQIAEQIAAATFRVDQESKIFDLATTRIGLENQLLQAQNAQTLLDMTRITMIQATLQAIATGNYSLLPGLSDLIAAIPQATVSANAAYAVNTENTVQNGLAQAYQTRSMMGYASYRGQNVGL